MREKKRHLKEKIQWIENEMRRVNPEFNRNSIEDSNRRTKQRHFNRQNFTIWQEKIHWNEKKKCRISTWIPRTKQRHFNTQNLTRENAEF